MFRRWVARGRRGEAGGDGEKSERIYSRRRGEAPLEVCWERHALDAILQKRFSSAVHCQLVGYLYGRLLGAKLVWCERWTSQLGSWDWKGKAITGE